MEDNGELAPTNVFKFFRAVDDNCGNQLLHYHTGVGTEGGAVKNILDGAFGHSLEDHIRDVYLWLAQYYKCGDKIFLVGFSRGAFSVRCLAGMLATPGLLVLNGDLRRDRDAVARAYEAYVHKEEDVPIPGYSFRDAGKPVPVHFLGVWDTVGALGIPDNLEFTNLIFDRKARWEFHDTKLGGNVKVARHAIAIDEMRSSFTVSRWHPQSTKDKNIDVEEKWFPGVHGDVGGGYQDSSLSDIALGWMMDEAHCAGLQFRKGISRQLNGDPCGVMHQSYKGVFAAFRSRPRRAPMMSDNNSSLHLSVTKRQQAQLINAFEYWPDQASGL